MKNGKLDMKVELEEHEREYIETMITRAELLAMKIFVQRKIEKDRHAIRELKNKFKKRDEEMM